MLQTFGVQVVSLEVILHRCGPDVSFSDPAILQSSNRSPLGGPSIGIMEKKMETILILGLYLDTAKENGSYYNLGGIYFRRTLHPVIVV